jgi:AraC-like DNA-binding protein
MALHGGEPLTEKEGLFGEAISFISQLSQLPVNKGLIMSNVVKEVLTGEHRYGAEEIELTLSPADEALLNDVFALLMEKAGDADFGTDALAAGLAMSQPTLYRKVQAATGFSPNSLIRWWRLQLAKSMLRRDNASVAQIAYACGFNSPSYFTKCFREAYGILPVQFMEAGR